MDSSSQLSAASSSSAAKFSVAGCVKSLLGEGSSSGWEEGGGRRTRKRKEEFETSLDSEDGQVRELGISSCLASECFVAAAVVLVAGGVVCGGEWGEAGAGSLRCGDCSPPLHAGHGRGTGPLPPLQR